MMCPCHDFYALSHDSTHNFEARIAHICIANATRKMCRMHVLMLSSSCKSPISHCMLPFANLQLHAEHERGSRTKVEVSRTKMAQCRAAGGQIDLIRGSFDSIFSALSHGSVQNKNGSIPSRRGSTRLVQGVIR